MALVSPLEAARRAGQVAETGKGSDPKGPGLTPKDLDLSQDLKRNVDLTNPDSAPAPRLTKGARRFVPPSPDAPKRLTPPSQSPENDKLRATPGTLERNMAEIDKKYGNDPKYLAIDPKSGMSYRDVIKYRIQRLSKPGKYDNSFLRSEALDTAVGILKGEKYQKGPKALRPDLYVGGHTPDRFDPAPSDSGDLLASFSDQGGSTPLGARTGVLDRIFQIASKLVQPDDYTAPIQQGGRALDNLLKYGDTHDRPGLIIPNDSAKGPIEEAARALGVFEHSARSSLSPTDILSSVDSVATGLANQAQAGKFDPVALAGIDVNNPDDIGPKILGMMAAGKIAHTVKEEVGGSIRGIKGAKGSPSLRETLGIPDEHLTDAGKVSQPTPEQKTPVAHAPTEPVEVIQPTPKVKKGARPTVTSDIAEAIAQNIDAERAENPVQPPVATKPVKGAPKVIDITGAGEAIGQNLRQSLHESVEKTGSLPSQEANSLVGQVYERMVSDGHPRGRETLDRALDVVDAARNDPREAGRIYAEMRRSAGLGSRPEGPATSPIEASKSRTIEPGPPVSTPEASPARPLQSAEGFQFHEERMNPNDLGVYPGLQYKKAGIVDSTNAVTDALKGAETYDQATAGPLTAWETTDGKRYVMNGHHRRELAIRTGEPDVPVRVFKEADGVDFKTARALGALQNLRDGKGTAIDAATVLRDLGAPTDKLRQYGINTRSGVAKDAISLLKLSDESLRMVEDGTVPEAVAAGIADGGLDHRRQAATMKEAARSGLETRSQGAFLAERARSAPIIDRSGGTGDLFGELDEGLALGEQAKIGELATRRLAQSQRAYQAFERAKPVGDTRVDVDAQTQAASVQEFARRVIATDPEVARTLETEAAAYAAEPTKSRLNRAVDNVVAAAERAAEQRLTELQPDRLGQGPENGSGRTRSDVLTPAQSELLAAPAEDLTLTPPDPGKAPRPQAGDIQTFLDISEPTEGQGGLNLGDAPQRPVKGRPYNPEAGTVDVKTLAALGIAGTAAAALIATGKPHEWYDYLKRHGLPRELVAGGLIAGSIGVTVFGMKNGWSLKPEGALGLTEGLLDPRTVAERAMAGDKRSSRLVGQALRYVVDAHDRHTVARARALQQLHDVASDVFGKKFARDKDFQAMDATVRDRMEQNVADGKDWHEGLTPKERKFVERVRSEVLDPILNAFENLGGRISVVNDGTQHANLTPGESVVRIAGGKYGVYEGVDHAGSALPDDPFGPDVPTLLVRVLGEWGDFDPSGFDHLGVGGTGETYTIKPGDTFGRPVNRLGDSFVPRIFSSSFMDRLKGQRTKAFNDALSAMLEQQNGGLLSGDEMMGRIIDVANSTGNSGRDIASFMANLEKERQWDLASFSYVDENGKTVTVNPYESSYLTSATAYAERGWKRVAIAEQMGADPNALGALLRGVKAADSGYGLYLERSIGQLLGLGDARPRGGPDAAIARAEGAYQAITKLTGLTTHVAQIGDLLMPVSEAGLVPFGKAVWKYLKDFREKGDLRTDAAILAGATHSWLPELRNGELDAVPTSAGAKIRKGVRQVFTKGQRTIGMQSVVDGVWTGLLLRNLDHVVKVTTVLTAMEDATAALRKATEATKSGRPVPDWVTRKLDRYGLADQVARATTEGVDAVLQDERVASGFAARVRQKLVYTGAAADNPLWMSTPYGSMAMRFKKPLVVTTRFIMNNVVKEATKGNLTPLVRFVTLGVAGGTISTYLKNAVRMDGFDEETRRLWGAGQYGDAIQRMIKLPAKGTLLDPESAKSLAQLLYVAGKNLYDSGNAGVFGEFVPSYNRRVQDLTGNYAPDMGKVIAPTSLASLENVLHHIFEKKSDIAEENWQQWRDSFSKTVESEVLPVRRIIDAFGLKSDREKVEDVQRKLRKGGRLSKAEIMLLGSKGYQTKGKFEETRKLQKTVKGMTYPDAVYDSVGLNKDLTLPTEGR